MNGIGGERSQPRKIHGRDGVVILVGRVYKCEKAGHEVVAYHPDILRQIGTPSLIPFRLWSRTGFTCDLMYDIEAMIMSGVSMSKIEVSLSTAAVTHYSNLRNRFYHLKRLSSSSIDTTLQNFPTYEVWCAYLPTAITPSRHAVTGCFLASFWEKSVLYERHMQATTITDEESWLSCDHTFASAG